MTNALVQVSHNTNPGVADMFLIKIFNTTYTWCNYDPMMWGLADHEHGSCYGQSGSGNFTERLRTEWLTKIYKRT